MRVLLLELLFLNACETSLHSLDCSSVAEYHIEIDTISSPLSFSWMGSAAQSIMVTELSGVTVWNVHTRPNHTFDTMDDINRISSPVYYGEDFAEDNILQTLTDPVELVTGAEYNVINRWGCSSSEENSEYTIDASFTAP